MCMVKTFKIYSLSSFQIYNTVLLIIVTMLYVRLLELIHLVSLYPLIKSPHFPHLLALTTTILLFCFYEFGFLTDIANIN